MYLKAEYEQRKGHLIFVEFDALHDKVRYVWNAKATFAKPLHGYLFWFRKVCETGVLGARQTFQAGVG